MHDDYNVEIEQGIIVMVIYNNRYMRKKNDDNLPVVPTKVHFPQLIARCQSSPGTTTCGL